MPTKIPEWVKFSLAIGSTLVALSLWAGSVQADLRVETATRTQEVRALHEADERYQKDVDDIKKLLMDEMERHHPRK